MGDEVRREGSGEGWRREGLLFLKGGDA